MKEIKHITIKVLLDEDVLAERTFDVYEISSESVCCWLTNLDVDTRGTTLKMFEK